MSVLIKGMEMPTRCFSCPMCDVENAEVNCAISHGSYIEYREVDQKIAIQERPSDCPLVEVQPHGDLVDINALKFAILDGDYVNEHDYLIGVLNAINDATTVIESNKDSESR